MTAEYEASVRSPAQATCATAPSTEAVPALEASQLEPTSRSTKVCSEDILRQQIVADLLARLEAQKSQGANTEMIEMLQQRIRCKSPKQEHQLQHVKQEHQTTSQQKLPTTSSPDVILLDTPPRYDEKKHYSKKELHVKQEPAQAETSNIKAEPCSAKRKASDIHKSGEPHTPKQGLSRMWRQHAAKSAHRARQEFQRKRPSWSKRNFSPEPLQKDLALAANILDEIAEERLAKRQRGEESQQLPQEEPDKEQTVNCLMMRESQFEKMKRTKTLLQTYSINGKHLPMEIFIIASIDNGSKSVCVGKCALTI
jgi:hypothetical protein